MIKDCKEIFPSGSRVTSRLVSCLLGPLDYSYIINQVLAKLSYVLPENDVLIARKRRASDKFPCKVKKVYELSSYKDATK